jgi:Domain of unknown function (DUF4279)
MLISVRLYIQGDDLQPGDITRLLGVHPTRSHARGDTRTLPDGKVVAEKIGVWVWKTGVDADDAKLSDCVQALQRAFGHSVEALAALPKAEATWIDVHVVEELALGNDDDAEVVFTLASQDIGALNALGLPVEFTVSVGRSAERT